MLMYLRVEYLREEKNFCRILGSQIVYKNLKLN